MTETAEPARNQVGLRIGGVIPGSADEGPGVPVGGKPAEQTQTAGGMAAGPTLADDLAARHDKLHADEPAVATRRPAPLNDMWRVDVAGYPCSVCGEHAKNHLEAINRKMARMKLALHKLARRDDEVGLMARLALEIDAPTERITP